MENIFALLPRCRNTGGSLERVFLKIDVDTKKMLSLSFRTEKSEKKEKTGKNLRYQVSVCEKKSELKIPGYLSSMLSECHSQIKQVLSMLPCV